MKNGSFGPAFRKNLAVLMAQAQQSMHPQLSTYPNGVCFALLVSMTRNRRQQLVLSFWV